LFVEIGINWNFNTLSSGKKTFEIWLRFDEIAARIGRPPEFGVGDGNANCPPQILSYKYKKERWPSK